MLRRIALAALLLVAVAAPPALAIEADQVRVIDGDTIRVFHKKPNVRLVGFNAPETRAARCAAERALGDRATRRLRDLVRDSKLEYVPVKCSCREGTHGTFSCNLGRGCGILNANNRDVGEILISEGLAVPFICGRTSCPPTPKPWCQ